MARLLFALHQFFPRFFTGTETLTLEIAEEMKRRGHEVTVLTTEPLLPGDCPPDGIEVRLDSFNNLPVYRIVAPREKELADRLRGESLDLRLAGAFERILDEVRPDLLHCFHLMYLTPVLVEVAHKSAIPIFFTATDFWLLCPTYQLLRNDEALCGGPQPEACFSCLVRHYCQAMPRTPLHFEMAARFPAAACRISPKARLLRQLLGQRTSLHSEVMQKFSGVFWSNSFMREMFHRNGFRCKAEWMNPFPVPERAASLYTLPAPPPEETLRVAFIGTLRESKGIEVFLRAIRNLKKASVDARIWGAPNRPEYQEKLVGLAAGDPRIHFCGTFPQEQFDEVLENTHVVVIPSLWYENTPLTALSALAARRILVVSDMGGLSSLVEDEVSGFLFPPGDDAALAAILARLAANPLLVRKICGAIAPPPRVKTHVDRLLEAYGALTGPEVPSQCNA
jgi:glycosyltransferase involved in cell wall biosynthesis